MYLSLMDPGGSHPPIVSVPGSSFDTSAVGGEESVAPKTVELLQRNCWCSGKSGCSVAWRCMVYGWARWAWCRDGWSEAAVRLLRNHHSSHIPTMTRVSGGPVGR